MFIVESYAVAVVLCVVTMLCWGSWANTQKLASKEWRFQLFYWDYCLGVLLLTVLFAFTLGSTGETGRGFIDDLKQAAPAYLGWAMLGGIVFNLANILLVAAIDIAGMAVAFPVGIGLALILGVLTNYILRPAGDPVLLFLGVAAITIAIIIDAIAYRRLTAGARTTSVKGIVLSIVCGVLMSQFYQFVARSFPADLKELGNPDNAGMLTPYTALVFFALGLFLSNFVFNTVIMLKPFSGPPVQPSDYFRKGTPWLHIVGILGGIIWGVGMSLNIIASDKAGPAISYGLGQGATMVAAFWGVFIWREFKTAPKGTNNLLTAMFAFFIVGLSLLIYAKAVEAKTPATQPAVTQPAETPATEPVAWAAWEVMHG
ncbi:MAG TPA: GRP family sugar transporter [Phycisphaerae bacterium]|nr:GRP family sugar transporter [Phycisphaerae bacterium]HOJ75828.1 GRP family sugar transporter [Phycisphaerae bacterium]HOM53214.1 GRP family sugar transporter [Phycisphaerae bacterium]HON66687.1 GRP family sugar transporter [Phycisphaerae bacterium]HOQ86010.1 GRP family sugar transporter [Phycisphaerae bacterium]